MLRRLGVVIAELCFVVISRPKVYAIQIPDGTQCVPSFSPQTCSAGECVKIGATCGCNLGSARRRASRVGLKACVGGQYLSLWYPKTFTQNRCEANKDQYDGWAFARMQTSFGDLGNEGECFVTPFQGRQTFSYRKTCVGVPDFSPYITITYFSSNCNTSTVLFNDSNPTKLSTCFCYQDLFIQPTSECATCDQSDRQCSTIDGCNNALGGRCQYRKNDCKCMSERFKSKWICLSGQEVALYYFASNASSCKAGGTGYALKAFNTPATCTSVNTRNWPVPLYGATHFIDRDCQGVPDGVAPYRTFFNNSNCTSKMPELTAIVRAAEDTCTCMNATETIVSECDSSCSGVVCQMDAPQCTFEKRGACAWTASQCQCASRVFKRTNLCYNGQLADIFFRQADYAECMTANTTDWAHGVVWPKFKTREYDTSQTCQFGGDNLRYAIYSVARDCFNVSNFGPPNKKYYSDTTCQNLLSDYTKPNPDPVECVCQTWFGCTDDTTYERYFCDGSGSLFVAEYRDNQCKDQTGLTNRSIGSLTDFGLDHCGAWPSTSLVPSAIAKLKFSCVGRARGSPSFEIWNKGDCTTDADESGILGDCYCKNEFRFGSVAETVNAQISGVWSMAASHLKLALNDPQFKLIVSMVIAEISGVAVAAVVNLVFTESNARRLVSAEAEDDAGGFDAEYTVVVPKLMAADVTTSLSSVSVSDITNMLMGRLTGAELPYTATVWKRSDASITKKAVTNFAATHFLPHTLILFCYFLFSTF